MCAGPFTGKGYALGIIDDPYKGPEDANSAGQRQKLIEWFQSVWLTRAEPGAPQGPSRWGVAGDGPGAGQGEEQEQGRPGAGSAAQVVVLTRWHQDDLIGWLLEQENGDAPQRWHVLNLPATCEPPQQQLSFPATCTLEPDWRQPGEPLCPERFPLAELEEIKIRAGSYWWNALYQQRPSPAEGLLFQRQWLRRAQGQQSLLPLGAQLRPELQGRGGERLLRLCAAGASQRLQQSSSSRGRPGQGPAAAPQRGTAATHTAIPCASINCPGGRQGTRCCDHRAVEPAPAARSTGGGEVPHPHPG